ncbi:MAG: hypothetical protein KAG20_07935 [Cocleimonas sp.]|nr:hypothetical protein [Cocleimonas sp.]
MSNLFHTFMGGSGLRPWLSKDGSERLFTLRLKGVEHPLDADPYWESNYGGGSKLYDVASESTSRRLKEALDAHRKLSAEKDDYDFPVEKMMVFSDVVMWLPSKIWSSSSREGGERLFLLSEKLKYRHRTDFSGELYKEREPHYAIMPLDTLASDEVIFQFGLGVYLPREEDTQTAVIKVLKQGQEAVELPHWQFFESPAGNERAATLYAEQHFLLLGNTFADSAIRSPLWFTKNEGYLMVDMHRQPNRIYGDDEYIRAGELSSVGDTSFCSFHSTDGKEHLKLVIERNLDQQIENTAGVETTAEFTDIASSDTMITTETDYTESPLAGLTVISSDEDPIFHYRYLILITGIILPRVKYSGIKYWKLYLNQQGMPAEQDEKSQWIIRGNQQVLEWCEAEKKEWQSLEIKDDLPFPVEEPLKCRAPVLARQQYGILMLPQSLASSLSHQVVMLGRAEDNPISLQLLNRHDSIEWQRITRRKQSMGHLGLSSRHLNVSVKGQNLLLQHLSRSAQTFILQDEMITHTLKPASGTTLELTSGTEIIVGNYLLQYNKEYIYDDKV